MNGTNCSSSLIAASKIFCHVDLYIVNENEVEDTDEISLRFRIVERELSLSFTSDNDALCLFGRSDQSKLIIPLGKYFINFPSSRLCLLSPKNDPAIPTRGIKFPDRKSALDFENAFRLCCLVRPSGTFETKNAKGAFDLRTEDNSAEMYFQFYGFLSQQQNMLQDFVRTTTYQKAVLSNSVDFYGKVVLDVGAGSGILSFFAAQAGARKVYAVEASSMAVHCQELVRTNGLSHIITVIPGKIEDIELPEDVDIIISEPMGYMLVNERMLESYLHSRKFLNSGGRMFPTTSNLYFAMFTDELVYQEQVQKSLFWCHDSFHGVDLSALRGAAVNEVFKQPIVDTWNLDIICSEFLTWSLDFEKDSVERLHTIDLPFELNITKTCVMHGIASYFDVSFIGSQATIVLSTAPTEPLTHWYQVRCFFLKPQLVQAGTIVPGRITLKANERLSYDVIISVTVNGVEQFNELDLKNPLFRYSSSMSNYDNSTTNSNSGSLLQQQQQIKNGNLSTAMSCEDGLQLHV